MTAHPSRSVPAALYVLATGLLISGYALGVFIGAPVLTVTTSRPPRKRVLIGLNLTASCR